MTVIIDGLNRGSASQAEPVPAGSVLDASTMTDPGEARVRFGEGFVWESWYVAGLSRAVEPGAREARRFLGLPILLGRTRNGQAFALRDRCAHRAVPLSQGRTYVEVDGSESVECPYHGWRFRADGACVAIPSATADEVDQADLSRVVGVTAYPVVEQQGLIWIWMSQGVPEARDVQGPPEGPPWIPGVVGRKPLLVDQLDYGVHIDHAILGLIDPAHGPFVHQQWWWRTRASQHVKQKAFAPSLLGFTMERHAPSSNSRAYRLLGGAPTTEIVFRLPGLRWEHVQIGQRTVLALSAMTPIDATLTRMHQIIWSDHSVIRLLSPLLRLAARAFLRQDGRIIAAQSVGLRDNPPLLWVGDADQQARWYAQIKREWHRHLREGRAFRNPVTSRVLRWKT